MNTAVTAIANSAVTAKNALCEAMVGSIQPVAEALRVHSAETPDKYCRDRREANPE